MSVGYELEVRGVAEDAAAAVRRVYEATGGQAMVPAVLEAARDEDSPLHRYFTWDDTAAAAAYRLTQAEELVRRIKVRVLPAGGGDPVRVRAFIATKELERVDGPAGSYRAIEDLAAETDSQVELLSSIRRDVVRLQRKYSQVREFGRLVRELLDEAADD
jgi:hypothetical protein